jgi:hypothetical protein
VSDSRQLAALARLHELFVEHAIDYWLFGGWAVDFHARKITRPHDDLDVAAWQDDFAGIAELLAADGWRHAPDEGEDGYTAFERDGVRLEVAFLAQDANGVVYTPLRAGGRAEWPAGAFEGDEAELSCVRARVIGLHALKTDKSEVHADPRVAAKDRADVATLAALEP